MNFIETPISGLVVIEPKIWEDGRGYFYESYNKKLFAAAGINEDFVQDNQSFSQKGALRGLHAQADPFAQGKLVRVIQGRVWDIAVDIRPGSATFGQHVALELSGENQKMFYIPPGFLHGFLTLEDNTTFLYKVTSFYDKNSEIGVLWNDPDLDIRWGIEESEVLLSEKDRALPTFREFTNSL
ncbi:MAG TPA: dTDP-4-dehydrorhamnose 3,5-epimerase [Sphingobacteriaceae bacterium]